MLQQEDLDGVIIVGPRVRFESKRQKPNHRVKAGWTEILGTKAEGTFGYRGEFEGFVRSCLEEERPRANLLDGAKDLLVSEAISQSYNTGKIVELDEFK